MILTFADAATADLFNGVNNKGTRKFGRDLWTAIRKRLAALNAAADLRDLSATGYNLHRLDANQAGRWAIRVNEQYRITFEFKEGHAYNVRCEDYH